MNIVSVLEKPNIICDNLYIFPFKKIGIFEDFIERRYALPAHKYMNFFIKRFGPINFLMNEYTYLNKLKFYKIIRNRINK